MAFADLNLNVDLEVSAEELSTIVTSLSIYRETVGTNPAVDDLHRDLRGLLSKVEEANVYVKRLLDNTDLMLPVKPEKDKDPLDDVDLDSLADGED